MRVTETISPAWERMKAILFRPFNLGAWFAFGFTFFLQDCVEGQGGLNVPSNLGDLGKLGEGGGGGGLDTSDSVAGALGRVAGALGAGPTPALDGSVVALIVAIAVVVAIPLVVLAYWLGSRGQMMAIHSVAVGQANVGEAWGTTRVAGGALFKFHLVLFAVGMAVLLPALGAGAALVVPAIGDEDRVRALLPMILGIAALALLATLPLAIVGGLGRNFVAPVMLKHGVGAREGWRRFWGAARGNVGGLVVFFLVKVLFAMIAGVCGVVAGLLTCCLGFMPVLHQTLMAPWYVFERAWTLEILASLGPEFDLRAAPPPPAYPPPGGWGPPGTGYAAPPEHWNNPYAPPTGGYGGPTA